MNFNIGEIGRYSVFELAVPLLFSLSFLVFIWGMFQYFIAGGHDEEAREKGKSLMMYGLIIFVLMLVVWGIATFLLKLLSAG